MSYSIIIPVYNSATSLRILYEKLNDFMRSHDEIIFVDDASVDASLRILHDLQTLDDRVKVIELKENQGQQYALYLGIKSAVNPYIITMDDDLQHPIDLLIQMRASLDAGSDLVYGIPVDQHSGYRVLGSKLTGLFFKRHFKQLAGKKVSSYRMFRLELGQKIKAQYDFVYISALLLPHVKKVDNICYDSVKRPYGQSGYNLKKLMALFLKLYFYYGMPYLNFMKKPLSIKRGNYEKNIDVRCRTLSD